MNSLELAKIASKIARDKKATRIVALDLRKVSDICQFTMICSGANDKQTNAIASAIEEHVKKNYGYKPLAVEGKERGHWILLDYGSVIIHIFFEYLRDYYALEGLWKDASFIDLSVPSPQAKFKPVKSS